MIRVIFPSAIVMDMSYTQTSSRDDVYSKEQIDQLCYQY